MEASFKMLHALALVLTLGGQFWWLLVWRPVYGLAEDEVSRCLYRRLRLSLLLGSGLFVLAGLADAIRAAAQVIEVRELGQLWFFLTSSRYGQLALLKSLVLPIGVVVFLYANALPGWLIASGIGGSSLGTVLILSLTSHAATQPGVMPVLSFMSHLIGAVLWGGGLLTWAYVPWSLLLQDLKEHMPRLSQSIERFSLLAFVAVVLLATAGVVTAFLHTYGLAAFTQTLYGRTIAGKIALFVGAIGVAAYHVLVLSPACRRQARRFVPETATSLVRSFARLVRLEALGVTGAILLAGFLTTLPTVDRPGAIVATSWEQALGPWHMHLAMAPLDEPGQVQWSVALQAPAGEAIPPDTQVFVQMRMPEHAMSNGRQRTTLGSDGRYRTAGIVSMAGAWQIDVTAEAPQRVTLSTTVDFAAVTGSRDQDRQRRLEFAAVSASPVHTLSCVLGFLFGVLALVVIWGASVGRMPRWTLLGAGGMLLCGGYLVLSIVLVNAYPTTYVKNPVSATPEAVVIGQQLFQEHCVACHGSDGRGTGPLATSLSPPPANLTATHLDDHTDGELFWWITYGMSGTAMPGWQELFTETQRWQLIHYVREIRRQARAASRP